MYHIIWLLWKSFGQFLMILMKFSVRCSSKEGVPNISIVIGWSFAKVVWVARLALKNVLDISQSSILTALYVIWLNAANRRSHFS